jgi:glycerol-3-phosphate acyltransferase PlsY
MLIYWILIIFISYIIGSIPFGVLISSGIAHIDITRRGSGNIGAANVAREVGLKWGLVTLVLDLLKGFVPIYIFYKYLHHSSGVGVLIVSLSTLIGHQYSVFKRFRGGKGVATSLGIFLFLAPMPAIIALSFFIITVYMTDFISLGSMMAVCSMPLILLLSGGTGYLIFTSLIMAALICFKHRENISRLLRGEERKWRKKPLS